MAKKDKEISNKKKGHYFKDMKAELKKVVWPSTKQTANNTLAVIVFALVVALVVFVLDVCFDAINKNGVVKLQEKITSSYNATTNEDANNEENATEENASESEQEETGVTAEVNTENNENEANTEANTKSQD